MLLGFVSHKQCDKQNILILFLCDSCFFDLCGLDSLDHNV